MRKFASLLILTGCVFWSACGEKRRAAGEADDGRASGKPKSAKPEDERRDAKSGKENSERGERNEKKEGGNGPVELSPAAQRRMGLVVARVAVAPLADVLTLTG